MSYFEFNSLDMEGAFLIDHFYSWDMRGSFSKHFERDYYCEAGIDFNLTETFTSISAKNVVRGLHFQLKKPQGKLITVLSGGAWDVIVDLRRDSITYKHWMTVELTENNHRSLYIPRGFAHGFVSLEDKTIMLYQCDGKYDPESDSGIRFDDLQLGIEWPIDLKEALISKKDLQLPSFEEYEKNPMML